MWNKYKIGDQPCDSFKPNDNEGLFFEHECIGCTTVATCENCFLDHHEEGFQTCKKPHMVDFYRLAEYKDGRYVIAADAYLRDKK